MGEMLGGCTGFGKRASRCLLGSARSEPHECTQRSDRGDQPKAMIHVTHVPCATREGEVYIDTAGIRGIWKFPCDNLPRFRGPSETHEELLRAPSCGTGVVREAVLHRIDSELG